MIVTDFPRRVREIEHVLIPLADGTRVAARIWLPEDAEADPVPAILEYLPYRKRDGTFERDALTHPYLAGHGYAGVRVDIRGSGESDGVLSDEYSAQELADGVEVIAWIARQRWCSGAVGMMGISWGGFNGLQIAALRPPALRAIITICSTDDRYADDVHFMGGALLNGKLGWASFFFNAMGLPPDPALVGADWRAMWRRRLESLPLFQAKWLEHQRRDAYWRHGSVCEDYAAIACPVFAVGGWTDGYTNAIPRLLAGLSVPRKGLIGPWAHAYPHFALPGPQIGFLQEALRWWDHWLKGVDTGLMAEPMLRAWMMESVPPAVFHEERPGRWVGEPVWPPAAPAVRRWMLADAGLVATGGGALAPRPIRSPQSVGHHAGSWCPFGRGPDDADDQREDDARSLVFDTVALAERIEILGPPVLELDLAADRPLANLAVRLCDVHPDGASLRVSFGILNLTHRESHSAPSPLEPGRRYRVRIQLNDAGFAFPAGHRIRLAVSTSYWPMIWPAPEAATVTLHGGAIELPVRAPRAADATLRPLPDAATAAPDRRTGLVATPSIREIGRDLAGGGQFSRSQDGPNVTRIDRLGIEIGGEGGSEYRIDEDDPLSARAETRRVSTIARGDWQVRVETRISMRATAEAFQVRASLSASAGDEAVFARDWDCTIPRDLV